MKRYEVVVNNEVFEVSLRELAEDERVEVTPQTAPVVAPEPEPETKAAAPTNQEGLIIKAPMSGIIMKILVKEGQAVKAGDDLFILEAMKMENEIKAPQDGIVQSILVKESQQVETKQDLAVI